MRFHTGDATVMVQVPPKLEGLMKIHLACVRNSKTHKLSYGYWNPSKDMYASSESLQP